MKRSPYIVLLIGSLGGALVGLAIDLAVWYIFPGMAASLQTSSNFLMKALFGFLYGGAIVGTLSSLIVVSIAISVYFPNMPGIRPIMTKNVIIAGIILGGIMGIILWEIMGARDTAEVAGNLSFITLGGLFCGFFTGSNANYTPWNLQRERAEHRKDFELQWGKPAPTYEEHLKATGQKEELREYRKTQKEINKAMDKSRKQIRKK